MKDVKIVFTGPPGAGKTTAIAALADRPPVGTDVRNTDASLSKDRTTVGLDFGLIDLGNGQSVRLFGTPGQPRFKFMWRVIATDALGLVILNDNSLPDPLAELAVYLDAYQDLLSVTNCVIGVGRMPGSPSPSIDDYCALLALRGLLIPVLAVDVRQREDVLLLVETLLALAETRTWNI
ncbi:MAG: GTP-binding protein [Betaproteobacteria bacterium]